MNDGVALLILNLDTGWKWVGNFTSQLIYDGESVSSVNWLGNELIQ